MTLSTETSNRRERFERLFDQHYRAVYAYVARRVVLSDADDVVAETFLISWRRLEDMPEDARPWLFGVARRVLANQRRAARRRAALTERVAHAVFETIEPSKGTVVWRALASLSDGDREVLMLTAWEALTSEQAARVLGCSRTAARVRLHRARRRLRRALTAAELEPVTSTTTRRVEGMP